MLQQMAMGLQQLRAAKVNDAFEELVTYDPINHNWVQRFLYHHPQFKTTVARAIEACCHQTFHRRMIWCFANIIQENDIKSENLYNNNETGFPIGTIQKTQIIVIEIKRSRVVKKESQ